jgi:predicted PurR-regulated permease PerM
MAFPAPSEKQAKVLWFSVTALAIAVFLALLAVLFYGIGWMIDRLTPVLLPLAVAGILAFLLNPLVDFFEGKMSAKKGMLFQKISHPKRVKAILLVFLIAVTLVSTLTVVILTTVVPDVIKLGQKEQMEKFEKNIIEWVKKKKETGLGQFMQLEHLYKKIEGGIGFENLVTMEGGSVGQMASRGLSEAITWIGLLAGMALVPVYVFYFLLEAQTIHRKWSDYLPLKESKFKEESVFVLKAFNDCLIVFFRGQVLVAMCVGTCLAIGFSCIGLPYGILLGLIAGMVGLIPYFGVIVSTIPVLVLSLMYGSEMKILGFEGLKLGSYAPLVALGVCVLILFLEKTVIQPKIIGDRVGMHPVAVIISVLLGTALVGGIIGGLLAIPIVMAGRTLLFRYIWKGRKPAEDTEAAEPELA